ncbi:KH domain protein [Clostridioides difficile F665]|nr:KH domain protein [Clostridioides difficile CD169]ERM49671.1 KH domain protein [Clostridioides difficile F665]
MKYMKELVVDIAKALVDNPDSVVVEEFEDNDGIILKLTVAQEDMGKVIGKQGRIAKAIRTVVRSVANRENIKVSLEIV